LYYHFGKKYYHQEKVEILVWNFLKPKIEWHRLEAEKFENQIMVVNVPINKKTERTVPSCWGCYLEHKGEATHRQQV